MLGLMKIVGIGAVLSAGVVMASEVQVGSSRDAGGKIYTDRVPQGEAAGLVRIAYAAGQVGEKPQVSQAKGDLLRADRSRACMSQAWPHIDPECLQRADGTARRSVPMITVEERSGANTSVLVRIPTPEIAQR